MGEKRKISDFHKKLTLISYFILNCFYLHSQEKHQMYFNKYMVRLDSISNNSLLRNQVLQSNFYFFSEIHNTPGLGLAQSKVNDFLFSYKALNSIFVEYPVHLKNDFKLLLEMKEDDTTNLDFENFYGNKNEDSYLLRNLYSNYKKTKFELIPINNIFPREISINSLEKLFPLINKDARIKKDFKSLKRIEFSPLVRNKYKFKYYLEYKDKVLKNKSIYQTVLGDSSLNYLFKVLEGIEICKNCGKNELQVIFSEKRENFLYKNIHENLSNNTSGNFIAISGHIHTTTFPNKCGCLLNFEILSTKIRKEINTTIIYFMNLKSDDFADKIFSEEKAILSAYNKDGGPKIIYLHGRNSPFTKMQKNYDFVVFW